MTDVERQVWGATRLIQTSGEIRRSDQLFEDPGRGHDRSAVDERVRATRDRRHGACLIGSPAAAITQSPSASVKFEPTKTGSEQIS